MKPHNLSNQFRQARMARFVELIDLTRPVRILDVGGTADYWRALPTLYGLKNVEITVVNLDCAEFDESNLRVRQGNACSLSYADNSFDIVHSNSVIEHVGGWDEMQSMAAEVRRLAPAHFIQTPNFWFPIEPHYKLPLIQFLPSPLRNRIRDAKWPGHSIELLSKGQMKKLFPDAKIEVERFLGLGKSLIAIRR